MLGRWGRVVVLATMAGCGGVVTCELDLGDSGTLCYDASGAKGYSAAKCEDSSGVVHEEESCADLGYTEQCSDDDYVIFGETAETCAVFNGSTSGT